MIFKKALILAPHTDDAEFGCGGYITKLLEEGSKVVYVAFSTAEESVPKSLPYNILTKEVKESVKRMGIPKDNLIIHNFPVRWFPQDRQSILNKIIEIRNNFNPDLVLTPATHDVHQDHEVINRETKRAFRYSTILGYELPWNTYEFSTQAFVELSKNHLKIKISAVYAYRSQLTKNYYSKEFIESLARTRGIQAGVEFAEAYEVIRWIVR